MTQWGLDTLFNPAKRHVDEEKRRLQSTREEIGDSSGGRRIDLESGKVRIERKGAEAEPAPKPAKPKRAAAEREAAEQEVARREAVQRARAERGQARATSARKTKPARER
jgi:hypothetical protein